MRAWPKIHPILGSSLIMLLLAGGVALSLRLGWLPGAAISFEMNLGAVNNRGGTLVLPLRLVLNNPSGRVQSLKPQNACKVFRWLVLDQTSAFVQSAPPADCDRVMIDRALRPWEEIEEDINIKLDAKRFKAGRSYYLIVRFWGLSQTQEFSY